jgi:hypothetical protein
MRARWVRSTDKPMHVAPSQSLQVQSNAGALFGLSSGMQLLYYQGDFKWASRFAPYSVSLSTSFGHFEIGNRKASTVHPRSKKWPRAACQRAVGCVNPCGNIAIWTSHCVIVIGEASCRIQVDRWVRTSVVCYSRPWQGSVVLTTSAQPR